MLDAKQRVEELLSHATCWNTRVLCSALSDICGKARFSSLEKKQAFCQACNYFDAYVKQHVLTSIGRNQFMAVFNKALQNLAPDSVLIADNNVPWAIDSDEGSSENKADAPTNTEDLLTVAKSIHTDLQRAIELLELLVRLQDAQENITKNTAPADISIVGATIQNAVTRKMHTRG